MKQIPTSAASRMTIPRQLLLSTAVTLTATLALLAIAVVGLSRVSQAKDVVIREHAPVRADARELDSAVADRAVAVRDVLLTGDQRHLERIRLADETFGAARARLQGSVTTATERDLLEQVDVQKAEWDDAVGSVLDDQAAGRLAEEDLGDVVEDRLVPNRLRLESLTEQLVVEADGLVSRGVAESDRISDGAIRLAWLLGGLLVALSIAIAMWIVRTASRRLGAFALTVGSAAAEVLAGASQQVAGTAQQAVAVQETATTVEELVQTAEQSTERARAVADRAQEAADVAAAGHRAIDESTAGMEQIREQVTAIATTVAGLAERAQNISDIAAVVDDVARQTHMLALNASIEAARAGEHGRGFSVVATEVRALAEQSRAATAQVSGIVADIQQQTQTAVLATELGTKTADAGVRRVLEAGETIRQLAQTIAASSLAAEQIAASAGQQTVATTQISQAMRDLDDVMQHSATAARQSEQAARDLDDVAVQLKAFVGAR